MEDKSAECVTCKRLSTQLCKVKAILQKPNTSSLNSVGGVLGDGLGALGDGVLGELTWEEETHSGLDFAGRESVLLVVADEARALRGNLLEDIVDERVHDAHGALGDASLGVDLLEDAVDVDLEGLGPSLLGGSLLGGTGGGAGSGSLSRSSLGHCVVYFLSYKLLASLFF